jgi:hypothetical protein
MACVVGPFEEDAQPPIFCLCLCRTHYDKHVEYPIEGGYVYFMVLSDDVAGYFLPLAYLDCIILFDVSS